MLFNLGQLRTRRVKLVSILFFFQAEDGIRDRDVTGVQTCALPIFAAPAVSAGMSKRAPQPASAASTIKAGADAIAVSATARPHPGPPPRRPGREGPALARGWGSARSEERRVGKECRSRWSAGE